MSEKYVIGIDEGSQSAKILIFDLKGNIVCEDKHPRDVGSAGSQLDGRPCGSAL